MNDKEIEFVVNAQSCEESNLFLRKFYDLMAETDKMGWCIEPYREEQKIFIGYNNFGSMSIDYKERGKLRTVYISTTSDNYKLISDNLKKAKETYLTSLQKYTVTVKTKMARYYPIENGSNEAAPGLFERSSDCNISVNMDSKTDTNIIIFNIEAYGKHDMKYVIKQKVNYLKHLLCVYTNQLFDIDEIITQSGEYTCSTMINEEYNRDWIECTDIQLSDSKLVVSPDFFKIFSRTLMDSQYDKHLRLILNSAQQLYCAKLMIKDSSMDGNRIIPGYVDLINTTLVSALEPLSNINAPSHEICEECGQLVYSIRKKVEDLCCQYLPHLKEEISKTLYSERSTFLHEGNAKTNEFYCGYSVPLIDPVDGRSIMYPVAVINYNMVEYVSYILRKVIKDYLDNMFSEQLKDDKKHDAIQTEMDMIRAIIDARTSQNLTQKELAERTGIDQTDIRKLENGTRKPSMKLLKRLAEGLGMTLRIEFVPKQNV